MVDLGQLEVLDDALDRPAHIRAGESLHGIKAGHLALFRLIQQVHGVFVSGRKGRRWTRRAPVAKPGRTPGIGRVPAGNLS